MSAAARDLDAALRAAHARGDGKALAALYTRAADAVSGSDARGFMLTQAYVFALESGAPQGAVLHARLCAMGRDA